MNVAVVLVGAALAYLFIVGLALVWNRGANCSSTPKPDSKSKDRSSSPIDSPCSTRLEGDCVAQELQKS
jgi:hypothetical protein